ncbi:hypothetical protein [Nocardia sp. NPDC050710]|uniref:hypothetical protein n=1 Tax=Nocardia sp. NPDC050710 TaxID=3157220 RepID=UPI003401E6E1
MGEGMAAATEATPSATQQSATCPHHTAEIEVFDAKPGAHLGTAELAHLASPDTRTAAPETARLGGCAPNWPSRSPASRN